MFEGHALGAGDTKMKSVLSVLCRTQGIVGTTNERIRGNGRPKRLT